MKLYHFVMKLVSIVKLQNQLKINLASLAR